MSMQQLLIPNKIKIGFNKRPDTYTGKLAYVIYYDLKGVLRKEKSWESWRDKGLAAIEYDNVPTEGFVLNKGVGGARHSYGWNARNEYIRVYDPRNFEFEISVANLLFILREGDCSRGKGLEGKFVYSWDGTELVLLPVASQDYQNSANFTKLQTQSVKAKTLIKGATYLTKRQEKLIYLGKFDRFIIPSRWGYQRNDKPQCQKHVFQTEQGTYEFLDALSRIATVQSDSVVPDYAERVDTYFKSRYGSKIVKLFLKKVRRNPDAYYDNWAFEEKPGTFILCSTDYDWNDKKKIKSINLNYAVQLGNGHPVYTEFNKTAWNPEYQRSAYDTSYYRKSEYKPYIQPTQDRLFGKLESGSEFQLSPYGFVEKEIKEIEEEVANGEEV